MAQSILYFYCTNLNNLKEIVKFDEKEEIIFDYVNVLDFWLIKFGLVKTKEIFKNKYIDWIKENFNNYLYNYLCVATFFMILKYYMMKISMLEKEVYKLTIAILMGSVPIFKLYKDIEHSIKLLLVYQKVQKQFN